ncbi:trigger factor [bacterium]|nr:trigger factor [bacterium]
MEISLERLAPCLLSLDIRVEKEKVDETINKALSQFRKLVQIPGFRKGKAPAILVRRYIGEERLKEEAGRILAEEYLKRAIEEKNIEIYSTQDIEIQKLEEGEDAVIKATLYTQPVVNLPPYDSIEVELKEVEVREEDVNTRLEMLRRRYAKTEPIKRKTVKRGDVVEIVMQVFIDGKPYKDETKDTVIVGDDDLVPPIDVYLEEMKVGEEKEIEVHYPPDFNNPELADKDAVIKVKVEAIKKLVLPELNDEFAKEASEFDTLEELKENIRRELEREAKKVAEEQLEREIMAALIARSQVEFPAPMLEEEAKERFRRFMETLERRGYDLDRYLAENNLTLEQLERRIEEEARDILIRRLILQEVGRKEGISVSEEEIEKRIEELAEANGVPKETMRRVLEETGRLNSVVGDLYLDKVFEFLKKSVKIKKKEDEI